MTPEQRTVAAVLRCLGGLDLLALAAVVMPRRWMEASAAAAGLSTLPPEPVVGYLARSAALMYALHGATVLYAAGDVARHWGLIRFLALAALAHGAVVAGIDAAEAMPLWWRAAEGPGFAATGLLVLWLQRRAELAQEVPP